MKKLFFLMTFVIVTLSAKGQSTGELRLQVGGDYGFEIERFGVNFGAEYLFLDNISVAPNFTVYFPEEDVNASNLNLDVRYYLSHQQLQFYGMAGFTTLWVSSKYMGIKAAASNSGANIGVGTVVKFTDNFGINPEVKYQTLGDGQVVVKAGLVYLLQ
ncbi:outer membrane beta-barrel protein [Echinicola sp. CAU 1574]|uniref:Outer membrane beta-barrel protein n=1 Tax=Echinicola arenosa TaxID=2774144 RepID=A0ABR9AKB2_9BACT|nr:outer membrane beta-barrel protein [Echinicola arenosa]MBD8489211.1 outer membrane beta-barrel protein [Echinicola arenosa]